MVAAVTFVWLGMVLGISFLEAPLKFRAPEVTVRIGLGIGRLVFRALNTAEVVFAAVVLVGVLLTPASAGARTAEFVAIAALALQLVAVRPRLNRRTAAVLADEPAPRSRAHLGYVALESIKALALLAGGVLSLH